LTYPPASFYKGRQSAGVGRAFSKGPGPARIFSSDIGLDQTRGDHAASVEMELKT
jgi:hypothetical protein